MAEYIWAEKIEKFISVRPTLSIVIITMVDLVVLILGVVWIYAQDTEEDALVNNITMWIIFILVMSIWACVTIKLVSNKNKYKYGRKGPWTE